MRRQFWFISKPVERCTAWSVLIAFLFSQLQLFAVLFFFIGVFAPTPAGAARLGTSTVSAGSAPPPAATSVDSFQPDLFTGRAATGVPIAVPPGRKGVQPSIGLGYSSSSRNGWVGVGWSLDLGFIERSTRKGVPRYDATDTFSFFLNNVNSELVRLGDGTYRAKDEGLFARFEDRGPAGWEVRDKSGTRYLFGQTAASRIGSGTNVLRWALDRVVDVNGNYMLLNYTAVDGLLYLSSIHYTGHESGLAPANRVEFTLENRPDVESSYRSGFLVTTRKRLAVIETKANGSLAMRYELTYRQSERTGRTLLAGVQRKGTNGTTGLPPVTFAYQDSSALSFTKVASQQGVGFVGWNVRGASYNCGHDNYGCMHPYGSPPCGFPNYDPPVVVQGGSSRDIFGVHVEVGSDGSLHVTGSLQDRQIHAWTAVQLPSARTLTLPALGGWDVCCMWIEDATGVRGPFQAGNHSFGAGWSFIHLVAYNQNNDRTDGFGIGGNLVSQVDVMSPSVVTEPQLAGDVDGNGIADIVDFNRNNGDWKVYCPQACSISPGSTWLTGFGGSSALPVMGDFDGDGRTDTAIYNYEGNWRFAKSTGTNLQGDFLPPLTFGSGDPLTGDFNGDGVIDLATYDFGVLRVTLGTGSGFAVGSAPGTPVYSSARDVLERGASVGDGEYVIDPDGPGGQPPIQVDCLMSLSGGGWTRLTDKVAASIVNTNTAADREYLFVYAGRYYRTPVSRLVWGWNDGEGKDLYGTYTYGGRDFVTETNFLIVPSTERTRYGVSGSSGHGNTLKCFIICCNPGTRLPEVGTVQVCQGNPGAFAPFAPDCPAGVAVYIREGVAQHHPATSFNQFSFGEPPPTSSQVAWKVRAAGWENGPNNYGCHDPTDNRPPYTSFVTISGNYQFPSGDGPVSVQVGGNGSIAVSGPRDHYAHATTSLYVNHDSEIHLTPPTTDWDVACLWVQDPSGVYRRIANANFETIQLKAGWSRLHIVGYNQNQGFAFSLPDAIWRQVDVMAPDPVTVAARPLQQLTGDFNGDGLTDIALLEGAQFTGAYCNGSTFVTQPPVTLSGYPNSGVFTADFNGDGLSDLAFYDRTNGLVRVGYGNTTGFSNLVNLSSTLAFSPDLRTESDQIQVADFNGDSLPDPAVFNNINGKSEIGLSQGGSPDLLVGIANGVGGNTAITYTPASHLGQHFLPFLTPLVTETRSSDGLGNSYTNTYSYSQGFYDGASKEFRGFGRVEVRDAEGNVAMTLFNQDSALKGRPSLSEFRDQAGKVWMRSSNTWETVQPYPGTDAKFVRLTQSDVYSYDGDATFKLTRSRMQYDAYGNVTDSIADGEVAVNDNERSAHTEYVLNTSAWILNRPSLVQSRDATGNVTAQRRFYYDNAGDIGTPPTKGQLTREEEWLDRDRTGPQTRWIATAMAYDGYGNVLRVTDALNHSVTNTYDASGTFLLQVANPLGHTRTMVYDPLFGHVTSSTDQNGVTTTSEYDVLGRVTKVIGPLDTSALPTTRYEYDLSSNPVRVTQYTRVQSGQGKELVSHTFTDGLGRTIQVRSPAQDPAKQVVTGTVEFDSKGRAVKQWVPYLDIVSNTNRPRALIAGLAPPVVHTYDPLGRLLTTTDPDGSSTSVAYDDWAVTTTDAKQHIKKRTSDAFGRLVQVQEFDGLGTNATLYATTTYQYDSRDNLVLLTDAVGNTTSLQYDSLNRKISMTDPDMGTWTYAYDDVDKLNAQTDARGVTINFGYDSLNRQTNKSYTVPAGIGVPTNQPPVIYTYDNPAKVFSKGKLTEITDQSGSSGFGYDTLGRLTNEVKVVDDTPYTIGRAYDLLGRLTALTYPNNDLAAYTYNDQGGIETITLQSSGQPVQPIINSVDYNAAGQITKMVYGNGVTTDYAYNPQTLRLQNLKSVGPGGVIQDFTYNFDAVGNVQSIADAVHTASQSFTYDSLNRLVTANGARYGNFTYAYNQVGNMTGKEGVTQNYGPLNTRPHAVTSTSSGLALTYDANGNLASKTGPGRVPQIFTFDAENRLVEVNSPVPARRLDPGWNFVSFPQVAGEVPVASVVTNFAGNCEQLTRFNASSNVFESFVNLPGTNQFGTVSAARGYALYVTNAAGMILPLGDTPATQSPQFLVPGKHLLPGPAETMSVSNWLAGLVGGVDYSDVRGLVSGTTNLATVTTVRPGQAYYVTMQRTNTWMPPSASRIENPSTVRCVYDGDGGRVKKITSSGITLFVGQSYEVSPTGQITAYVFAGGERVAAKDSFGSLRIYHSDHLGSANVITDQGGSTVEITENTPYGSVSRHDGSVNVAHKFTGQRLDGETGLYFYNARYYDPEIGRFISPDIFAQDFVSPQTFNRYSYAANNPIIYSDPSGHFAFLVPFAIAAFKGALIGAAFGAGMAAITGQNIGQGALMGAISGAITGGIGHFGSGFQGPGAGNFFARSAINSLGSAAASGVTSAMQGGNWGKAALTSFRNGMVTAGANYAVGQWSGYSKDTVKILGKDGEEASSLPHGGKIGINGIVQDKAKTKAIMIANGYDGWLHNPTHNGLADLVESGQELFFGPSEWSRSAAGVLDVAAASGGVYHFVAHSQGGLMFGNSLGLMQNSFNSVNGKGSFATFINTPFTHIAADSAGRGAGLSKVIYRAHAFDIVSALGAPHLLPTAIIALPAYGKTGAEAHIINVWENQPGP